MQKYKDIEYSLTLSDRKTMSIYVDRDTSVSVLAPKTAEIDEIEKALDKKLRWIYKNQAEFKVLNPFEIKKEYISGENFSYLGRNYMLKLVKEQEEPLRFYQNRFYLRQDCTDKAKELFKEFYRAKGLKKVTERINLYKGKLGVKPNNIRVLELQNRWASCSDKSLNFHWKCLMAPVKIIDYIVVHELAHLKHPNHTESFWNLVDKVMPDFNERKEWLKLNGSGFEA